MINNRIKPVSYVNKFDYGTLHDTNLVIYIAILKFNDSTKRVFNGVLIQ